MRNLDIQIERWPVDRLIPSDVDGGIIAREGRLGCLVP